MYSSRPGTCGICSVLERENLIVLGNSARYSARYRGGKKTYVGDRVVAVGQDNGVEGFLPPDVDMAGRVVFSQRQLPPLAPVLVL